MAILASELSKTTILIIQNARHEQTFICTRRKTHSRETQTCKHAIKRQFHRKNISQLKKTHNTDTTYPKKIAGSSQDTYFGRIPLLLTSLVARNSLIYFSRNFPFCSKAETIHHVNAFLTYERDFRQIRASFVHRAWLL